MSDKVFGENTDGMELYNIDGREILVVNSEYTNRRVNLPHAENGVPTGLGRRAHPAAPAGREHPGDRGRRERLGNRGRQPLQPPHPPQHRDDLLRPRRRSRPAEDRRRSDGDDLARHDEQLRLGPDAVGHLPDLRGKLQRLFRLDRNRAGPEAARRQRRLPALWHRRRRLGLRLPQVGRALGHVQAPERAAPRRLHRGNRPGEPGCHARQAHRARPLQARERRLRAGR